MVDKSCILQIIGGLMKKPLLLSQIDRYNLSAADFPDLFTRKIFLAIGNLYEHGANRINPIDVENILSNDITGSRIFKERKGIDYLNDATVLSDEDNFDYYYERLKKINLLNDLNKQGFNTSSIYCEDLTNPKMNEINLEFDRLSLNDIVEKIKKKFLLLSNKYIKNEVSESSNAFEGIYDLLEAIDAGIDVGEPLQGEIFNQIVDGAVLSKLYIRSAQSGVGKTRHAVGDACFLAFPFYYNWESKKWVNKGNFQKVLFIATEQQKEEIQKMILAYLTGINESKIKHKMLSEEEKHVIQQALWVWEKYQDNFIICRMPNPTIELVKAIVRENCIVYGCEYVFYDYIFIGPSLINEFKGVSLRNDEVLLMFATALKDLAVELNVFIMTSTQLNAKGDNNGTIKNESALAGGRATINKADVGAIMSRPTKEELDFLSEQNLTLDLIPNVVTDIYKVRSGEWTQVRIWSFIDLGTLRKEDLFVTDSRFGKIDNFVFTNWENLDLLQHQEEIREGLKKLND